MHLIRSTPATPPTWATTASTSRAILTTTTALTSIALLFSLGHSLFSPSSFRTSETYIPSPPKTWSSLRRLRSSQSQSKVSKAKDHDEKNHPYPPEDALPGARDITSPYGSIRSYEWGPEDGEKVLLVHGISTPGIALGDLAHELAGRGFRVMVFDLFGRGYSDAPSGIPYDARLYATQILLVVCGSNLPGWTTDGFHLVGYSLGGCLCAAFAAHMPQILLSLNLIATSGLIRKDVHVGWSSWWLYDSGLLPEALVRRIVWKRIRPGGGGDLEKNHDKSVEEEKKQGVTTPGAANPADLLAAETSAGNESMHSTSSSSSPSTAQKSEAQTEGGKTNGKKNGDATGGPKFDSSSISRRRPGTTISSVVRWQMDAHREGFLTAFLSTIRRSPIYAPQRKTVWEPLKKHLDRRRRAGGDEREKNIEDGEEGGARGLRSGKVLFVLGEEDSVIDAEETVADAKQALGEEGTEFVVVKEAGHELVITESVVVSDALVRFWRS